MMMKHRDAAAGNGIVLFVVLARVMFDLLILFMHNLEFLGQTKSPIGRAFIRLRDNVRVYRDESANRACAHSIPG